MPLLPRIRRIWDLSPAIQSDTPVWPGEAPFAYERTSVLQGDCPVNVSRFSMCPHTGSHTDAPFHYDPLGVPIGSVDLDAYIGPCRVIHAIGAPQIEFRHLQGKLTALPQRVLFRAYATYPRTGWDSAFASVAVEVIELLARCGVKLIGIDTPSLDPELSLTMDAHLAVRRNGMAILESIVLDDVDEGDYELIALPLKFSELDASPVRAILRSLESGVT